jgi:hypothetical protein
VSIVDGVADVDNNQYVIGSFNGVAQDFFIGKFDADGKLIWRKDVSTPTYDYPGIGVVVSDGIVYANVCREDAVGIGDANTFVYAYNADSGNPKWSTQTDSHTRAWSLNIKSGYIYQSTYSRVSKLDLNGNILKMYAVPGSSSISDVAVTDDAVFVGGASIVGDSVVPVIWKLDLNLNSVWPQSQQGTIASRASSANSIITQGSLIFVGESYGDLLTGIPTKTFVVCYEVLPGGLNLKWRKQFDNGLDIGLKRNSDNDFYVFSRDIGGSAEGPIRMSIDGNILWTASPKRNGNIIVSGGKVFVADGTGQLSICN